MEQEEVKKKKKKWPEQTENNKKKGKKGAKDERINSNEKNKEEEISGRKKKSKKTHRVQAYKFWSKLEAKHNSVPFSCSRIGYRRTMTSFSANDEAPKVAVPPERRRVFGAGVLFPTPGSHTHTHTHTQIKKTEETR